MAKRDLSDRFRGFRYLVEIEGVPRAAFGYCAGLGEAHAPVAYYIGDDEVDLLDVAQVEHPSCLILAQGIAFDDALDAWRRSANEGQPEAHDGAIVEYDGRGYARRTFHFRGAFPSFYQGVRSVGSGAERHIDTLELVYDDLTSN
jgi:hypothetical protein